MKFNAGHLVTIIIALGGTFITIHMAIIEPREDAHWWAIGTVVASAALLSVTNEREPEPKKEATDK